MAMNILIFLSVGYGLVMLFMFLFQRNLMYYPETAIEDPAHYGITDIQVFTLDTHDKITIEAWYRPAAKSFPTIVYFHGNAGHIGNRIEKLIHFTNAGFGMFAISYRGYGKSKGQPSESGLYEDARAAVHYATTQLGIAPEHIILYGESLGSGVATHTAKAMADAGTPAGGLVLEAGYTSVARRAQELYPFIPAYYLARDKYHSIGKIGGIGCPLLLFHGAKDTVIPIHHGRSMLDNAPEPKRGVFFDEVDHTAFDFTVLTHELTAFAKEHGLTGKA